MTLVAAYRERDVPVLIGDFLLTGIRGPAGLRKKVHRLCPNLVVGWTGHMVAAQPVLTDLHDRFQHEAATVPAFETFLKRYPTRELSPYTLQLVGWILDGAPRCFRWNSEWPHEIFYADHQYGGSGENTFRELAGTGSRGELPPPYPPERLALEFACRLMANEVDIQTYRAAGFGYAYEVLYLDGAEFKYIDNVLYVFAEVHFDSSGRYTGPHLHPTTYRYHHIADCAILQSGPYLWDGTALKDATQIDVITPAYAPSEAEARGLLKGIVSPQYPISYEANYYCLFASIIKDADTTDARPLAPLVVVASREDEIPVFSVKFENSTPSNRAAGTLSVTFPAREMFEIIYQDATAP